MYNTAFRRCSRLCTLPLVSSVFGYHSGHTYYSLYPHPPPPTYTIVALPTAPYVPSQVYPSTSPTCTPLPLYLPHLYSLTPLPPPPVHPYPSTSPTCTPLPLYFPTYTPLPLYLPHLYTLTSPTCTPLPPPPPPVHPSRPHTTPIHNCVAAYCYACTSLPSNPSLP